MNLNTLRLTLGMGMLAALTIATSPAQVNAQTQTRTVCVRRIFGWCVQTRVIVIQTPQPSTPPRSESASSAGSNSK